MIVRIRSRPRRRPRPRYGALPGTGVTNRGVFAKVKFGGNSKVLEENTPYRGRGRERFMQTRPY